MSPMDVEKPAAIAFYSFTVSINDALWEGRIPALSAEHAESMVKQIGGEIRGRLINVRDVDKPVCSICAGDLIKDMEHPQPVEEDDWELDDFGE